MSQIIQPGGINESDHDLLVRIDERTSQMVLEIAMIKSHYVRREEFEPIKRLAYGLAATILVSVIGWGLSLVVRGASLVGKVLP